MITQWSERGTEPCTNIREHRGKTGRLHTLTTVVRCTSAFGHLPLTSKGPSLLLIETRKEHQQLISLAVSVCALRLSIALFSFCVVCVFDRC